MSTHLLPVDSMYGHIAKLAEKVKAGLDTVPGIKATIYRVRKIDSSWLSKISSILLPAL